MQRSQKIRILFDSMNHEMALKNESVYCASLKNKQSLDRLLVFMSGMCYQVYKGESMLHSAHSVCSETDGSLSTFSPHTEPPSHSTIKHLERDQNKSCSYRLSAKMSMHTVIKDDLHMTHSSSFISSKMHLYNT